MKKAFTMVELVFAIVIIGILASVAVPKLAATRDDAEIVSARTTVSALRTAIATERQKRILRGNFDTIDTTAANALMSYPLSNDWTITSTHFIFKGPADDTCFFTIDASGRLLKENNCTMAGMNDL